MRNHGNWIFSLSELGRWLAELEANLKTGDLAIADVTKWDPASWPAEAQGWGMEEAPRGALAHWVVIKEDRIDNYQAVGPSTWNAGPRDAHGQEGPYEAALKGHQLHDPKQPIEILRTMPVNLVTVVLAKFIAAWLFIAAALVGIYLFMRHLRRRRLSGVIIATHMMLAITGFVVLIAYWTFP